MLAASLRSQIRSGAGTGNEPGDEVGGQALAPTAHLWLDVPSFQLWRVRSFWHRFVPLWHVTHPVELANMQISGLLAEFGIHWGPGI